MENLIYRVAQSEEEYAALTEFQQRIEEKQDPLGFPTLYSMDEQGYLHGFVTTTLSEENIPVAGPLVTDPQFIPRYEATRTLLYQYLALLKHFGLSHITFGVNKTNQKMFQAVCAEGLKPFTHDEENWWFQFDLT